MFHLRVKNSLEVKKYHGKHITSVPQFINMPLDIKWVLVFKKLFQSGLRYLLYPWKTH